jgi:hypothetical protein
MESNYIGDPQLIIKEDGKVTAKVPPIGSLINVYADELQRSVPMEVFDRTGNLLSCGYEGIEYTVRLAKMVNSLSGENENVYRWEGSSL